MAIMELCRTYGILAEQLAAATCWFRGLLWYLRTRYVDMDPDEGFRSTVPGQRSTPYRNESLAGTKYSGHTHQYLLPTNALLVDMVISPQALTGTYAQARVFNSFI